MEELRAIDEKTLPNWVKDIDVNTIIDGVYRNRELISVISGNKVDVLKPMNIRIHPNFPNREVPELKLKIKQLLKDKYPEIRRMSTCDDED